MKIVAVTACPTGIAHTYMAADALKKAAQKLNIKIKVETQGAMGVENELQVTDISCAERVIIASDIDIEQKSRFNDCVVLYFTIEEVLSSANEILARIRDSQF